MNEQEMVNRVQAALAQNGVDDRVEAAAIFLPRGHFAGAFAGGFIGDELVGGGIGAAGGALAGMKAVDAAASTPERCMVAVTPGKVYGFDTERGKGGRVPTRVVFAVDRGGARGEGAPALQRARARADRGRRCGGRARGPAAARVPRRRRHRRAALLTATSGPVGSSSR
jgi:hypothetical protein